MMTQAFLLQATWLGDGSFHYKSELKRVTNAMIRYIIRAYLLWELCGSLPYLLGCIFRIKKKLLHVEFIVIN